VTRQDFERRKRDRIGERCACACEQFFEHPSHREDGWTTIDVPSRHERLPQFATGVKFFFEDGYVKALRGQIDRASQSADASADDRDHVPAQCWLTKQHKCYHVSKEVDTSL
jgi:hypothetical protein